MSEIFSLGDSEQHRRKLSGVAREEHERIVEANLNKFSAVKAVGSPSDEDLIVAKLKDVHVKVMQTMKPILIESHKKGVHDRSADKTMLASLYLQQLDSLFSKDEVVFLLTAMITEELFNKL